MTNILSKGHELYAALNSGDADALQRLLRADFNGRLSPGLPRGLGKNYSSLASDNYLERRVASRRNVTWLLVVVWPFGLLFQFFS